MKLLDHFWHEAHARRLDVLPVERDYIWHDGWPRWNEHSRPYPHNRIVDRYEPGQYDAVILHVDEVCWRYQSMAPQFRELRSVVKEPIIVINHGAPENYIDVYMMRDWLDGCHMVTNSAQAASEWGWGTPIIHGYDAREWPVNTKDREPEIVTCVGGWRGFHHEYNGCDILERLMFSVPVTWIGLAEKPATFDEYRHVLGRGTIYVNPTRRSPMPGARTEAMLMGLCVVSLPGHDTENYIEHGKTGYIVEEPELESTLLGLLKDPATVRRVGLAGAEAARAHFSTERYINDWMRLLGGINGNRD